MAVAVDNDCVPAKGVESMIDSPAASEKIFTFTIVPSGTLRASMTIGIGLGVLIVMSGIELDPPGDAGTDTPLILTSRNAGTPLGRGTL